jgi:hypothetical protein
MEETPLTVEAAPDTPATNDKIFFQPEPKLDEQAVREAIIRAEQTGKEPMSVTRNDLVQGTPPEPAKPADVPEKFKTPTGEVDVEKLKTSTEQLNEAIVKKEAAVQKTVDDYVREYRQKEQKFRSMPNPEKLAANLQAAPPPPVPEAPARMSDQQLREILMKDYQADPIATTAQLIDIAIQKRLEPYEEDRKFSKVKENINSLAEKDARVLQPEVFAAINAKLDEWAVDDPARLRTKNPHRLAWLEVKEEMRLGDLAKPSPAQPSKPPAPILGGGTPPPAPSSSGGPPTYETLNQATRIVNPKDPNQMAALEKAMKEYMDRNWRR